MGTPRKARAALFLSLFIVAACGDDKEHFQPSFAPDFNRLTPLPEVVPVTAAQRDAAIVRPDRLYFPAATMSDVADWQPGRLVVSAPGTDPAMGNPLGFARRVTAVKQVGDMLEVETTTATIEELFRGDFQVRIDEGAVAVEPEMFDTETMKHLEELLYPPSTTVGFFNSGKLMKHNAPEAPAPSMLMPGQNFDFPSELPSLTDIAQAGTNAAVSLVDKAADSVGCCEFATDAAQQVEDFILGRTMSLDNAASAALVAIREGDFRAALAAGAHLYSAFSIPPLPGKDITGTFTPGANGSPAEIGLPKLKYFPYPRGFEFTKAVGKKGNTLELFVKGNAAVAAGFKMRPAFQFGVTVPPVPSVSAVSGFLEMNAEVDLDIDLELDVEAGIHTVSLGNGPKLSKGSEAFKKQIEDVSEAAKNVYAAEREALLGDKDFTPPSSFVKTLLRTKPYVMTFSAGGVPIVITWAVTLDLVCGFEAKATIAGKMSWQETMRVRTRIDAGTGRVTPRLPEVTSLKTAKSVSFLGGGKATAACGLVPRVNAMLYDTVGMNVGVRGSIEAEVELKSECKANETRPSGKLEGGLYASVGVPLGGKIQIPGVAAELVKTPEFELWNKRFQLTSFSATFDKGIGYCTPTCRNGVLDADETDVDCGGVCVTGCQGGKKCTVHTDCGGASVCSGGTCTVDTCSDGVRDGDETDVDCGGTCRNRCPAAKSCKKSEDCGSGYCNRPTNFPYGSCVTSSCEDGALSPGEHGIDCGGGGCGLCGPGKLVDELAACASGFGVQKNNWYVCTADSCGNQKKDGVETDVDCGGENGCFRCGPFQACATSNDCMLGSTCQSGKCMFQFTATCDDRLKNQGELGVDCGGPCSNTKCKTGEGCTADTGCNSGRCALGPNLCGVGTVLAVSGIPPGGNAVFALEVNGTEIETQTATSDGMVMFQNIIGLGRTYRLVTKTPPADSLCNIANGVGAIGALTTSVQATATCAVAFYSLGATITGATGAVTLTETASGQTVQGTTTATFAQKLQTGSNYALVVSQAPVNQNCTITAGASGTIGQTPVTATVACATRQHPVNARIDGLDSSGLRVSLNGQITDVPNAFGNSITVTLGQVTIGQAYTAAMVQSPSNNHCLVTAGATGVMADAPVNNVVITCTPRLVTLSGQFQGLDGTVIIQVNGSQQTLTGTGGNVGFSAAAATEGSPYSVSVLTQPRGYNCTHDATSDAASGTLNVAFPPSNIRFICRKLTYTIGGTVSGLVSGQVQVNLTGAVTNGRITGNGAYTFSPRISHLDAYTVTVDSGANHTCTVSNGTGIVDAADISNIDIACTPKPYTVQIDVDESVSVPVTLRNAGGTGFTIQPTPIRQTLETLPFGTAYTYTVDQPVGLQCSLTPASGVAGQETTYAQLHCAPLAYSVSGQLNGIAGQVVIGNGADVLTLTADGMFSFPSMVPHTQAYHVAVREQPEGYTCTVGNGQGTINAANVTNVTVACVINSYTVGGVLVGMEPGRTIVLQNLGGDDLTLSANGAFTFNAAQIYQSTYDATIFTSPAGQTCTVTNGAGSLGAANVTNIVVNCGNNEYAVGGTVTGLTGTLRIYEIDTGEEIDLTANGPFVFPTPRVYNQFYYVDVMTNPPGQLCWVANEFGEVKGDVANLAVHCNDAPGVTIAGTVTGLDNGATIELEQGQGDRTTRIGSGPFTFGRKLPVGAQYKVGLSEFITPHNATCTVINGTGVVPAGGVTNIEVACVTWRTVFVKRDANGVDSGGNLAGTAGADARCGAGFRAWVSDAQSSPATRFTHFAGEYRLPSGAKVADNWADLTDGTLDHAINEEADGWLVPAVGVYTATAADGTFTGEANCSNWTSTGSDTTRVGDSSAVSSAWTASSQVKTCSNNETTFAQRSLVYCFEQ